MVLGDGLVTVLVWYDNECGFSAQMLSLARHVAAEAGLVDGETPAVR